MINTCQCDSHMQDKLHGTCRRVFNSTSKDNTYRCSVCTKEIKTDMAKKKGKK